MAGPAELPKRKRKPVAIHHLPPNVRAFAEHLAAAVAADILREIRARRCGKLPRKPEEGRGGPEDEEGK
ncbi:MAG TPA: hypothetical protein VK714_19285 [Myxococcota bacterium]|nr:hypothetical protein [Myxococcota bacterium]